MATMNPLGWNPLHPVDNPDTQHLGNQNWQKCWCFRFSFFFVSICLSMFHSVCVSVYLFRINLKVLNTHNYSVIQLLYVSLVSGLELKLCRVHIKMLRNSSKKNHYCPGLGRNSLFSNLNSYCYYDYYVSNSVIRVVVKFFWLTKIIFQVFCVFLKN